MPDRPERPRSAGEPEARPNDGRGLLGAWRQALRNFMYGMVGLEFERHEIALRASLESVFMTVTFGDLLGLPVLPPLYSLRLLPYVVPHIATWKRRALREREFSDSEEFDLHGI